jgi:uncharacterized YccA/Bax inhibitor family protein
MRTANPAFREGAFAPANWPGIAAEKGLAGDSTAQAPTTTGVMTIQGTIIKSGVLLTVCAAAAMVTWNMVSTGTLQPFPTLIAGLLGGFVMGLIITFNPRSAPYLSIPYAVCEGVFLGVLSYVVAQRLGTKIGPTTVLQAIMLTFGILAALLIAFSAGLVRLGSTATKCVVVATGGLAIFYLVSFIMNMAGWGSIGLIYDNGPIGIGFSLFVIVLASLNLVLDFQFIEGGAAAGAPKYMEWYGAFGLLVTLVWLYIEVLRLLSKLNRK